MIPIAEGRQGPRSYLFSAQRVRPTSRRKPGEIHWAVYRRNRDGSEPRYYLSNAPEDTPRRSLCTYRPHSDLRYVRTASADGRPVLSTRPL